MQKDSLKNNFGEERNMRIELDVLMIFGHGLIWDMIFTLKK